ncbi:MAG: hypothetical protein FWE88_09700, partial [Phycisphaerae bacterium]|nr:hypothetical protein [Phycisphaerae bacterium]
MAVEQALHVNLIPYSHHPRQITFPNLVICKKFHNRPKDFSPAFDNGLDRAVSVVALWTWEPRPKRDEYQGMVAGAARVGPR